MTSRRRDERDQARSAAWVHPERVYSDRADGYAPDGAVIVRFSNRRDERPYYLQRVIRRVGYYGAHMIENERFATVEEAVAQARQLGTDDRMSRPTTIVPRTGTVQRRGLSNDLYRIVTVHLNANKPCKGGGNLHEVHALKIATGERTFWFATDAEAQRAGWL